MGTQKCVYIRNDIEELVKKEENLSGLINNLLKEHYSKINNLNKDPKELVKQKIEELEAQKKVWEEKFVYFTEAEIAEQKAKDEEELKKRGNKEEYLNSPERWARIRETQLESFKGWEVSLDRFEEYFEL